jgi:hypothetical protein
MNWVSVRAVAFAFLVGNAVFASAAIAARLRTSTLVVQVLSVDQESLHSEPSPVSQGKTFGDQSFETSFFVAKARIQDVIQNDYALAPGETIEIHYKIRTAKPRPLPFKDKPLEPGKTMTLEVTKGNGGYELRQ